MSGEARIKRMRADDDLANVGIAFGCGAQVCGDGDATLLVDRLKRKSFEELPVRHAVTPDAGTASPSSEISLCGCLSARSPTVKGCAPS